jgi:hypothetical protein
VFVDEDGDGNWKLVCHQGALVVPPTSEQY